MIPNLLNDLHMIYKLDWKEENKDIPQDSTREEWKGDNNDCQQSPRVSPVLDLDLNCLPYEEDKPELPDNEIEAECLQGSESMLSGLGGKKKRAPSDHVAKISFSDLVKYFDMPIVEASRHLNVGLTVLKRKCREFGIPRWPHRKIKSLDSLIHDLQEVAKHPELEDEAAAMAVTSRQKMLENEKENIEKKPFMDIQSETKRFRQDVFKRRHRARAIEKQSSTAAFGKHARGVLFNCGNISSLQVRGSGSTNNNNDTKKNVAMASCASSVQLWEGTTTSGKLLEITPNLKVFTFADLKAATKGFKSDALLGEGGFGKVYKGWLDEKTLSPAKAGSGMMVAIKKLKPESMQGVQEWQSEINFLGSVSHPNLVKLLGYCREDDEFLLVYEFMPKGSLENHLFRGDINIGSLSWNTRLKIAIGAARGLAFLHTSEKQVIYRDFKASNILLDGNFNAKISDFGLAKFGPSGGDSHVTTRIMGTFGYAAPEYIATGHLYVNSDVYGFGVVLLEMLTGLQAFDTKRPQGEQNLVEWIKPSLSDKRKLKTFVDVRIEGQYSLKAALEAAQLTLKCHEPDPKKRPSMKDVLATLESIEAIKDKRKVSKKHCTMSAAMHNFH
ncbi:Serine/threonine-protein kinase, active site [Sesbania bispinosa]|nr:Serine/threonine-protein kinase, active site [Sesbania bispinosa]